MISIARNFGAPVIDSPGKTAAQHVEGMYILLQPPSYRTDQMMNPSKRLHREQFRYFDGAKRAGFTQIVAQQIDDHEIFGAIFRALQ